MRRLESEGLLQCDTHRGFTVRISADGSAQESSQIRAALESVAASLAASKIDADGLSRLAELSDRMRALADDDPAYPDLNREFHFTVCEFAGSPLLLWLMRPLWASLIGSPRAACQHDAVVAALQAGDGEAAAARTREHIIGTGAG